MASVLAFCRLTRSLCPRTLKQYNVTFFGIGLCKICAWDFRPRPEGEEIESIRGKWKRRRVAARRLWKRLRGRRVEKTDETEDRRREGEATLDVSMGDAEKAMVDEKNLEGTTAGLGYQGGFAPVPTISRAFSLS